MRSWLVAGAVIEGPEGMLLVANRRRTGEVDWSTPGGVIDEGEEVLAGLAREVHEETGLAVVSWGELLYGIEVHAPDLGWDLRVEVHRAAEVRGDLRIDDPDGIVVDACWVAPAACPDRLAAAHPWVREPLSAWVSERWPARRDFRYLVEGADPRDLVVSPLA
ncbi:MAG: NUDIX hydrolase [Acidimicrobiales bacterium]|nr:NUDIX hydrolase [Acidimicrobiales bacterium]